MKRTELIAAAIYIVGMLSGLLGNVVAGFLAPTFEQRPLLTVGIFVVLSGVGLWLAVFQEQDFSSLVLVHGLERVVFNEVVRIIVPEVTTENERQTLLTSAFPNNEKLTAEIDISGSPKGFATKLIKHLSDFGNIEEGKPALWVLLETVREGRGVDVQKKIDEFRPAIEALSPPHALPVTKSQAAQSWVLIITSFVGMASLTWYLATYLVVDDATQSCLPTQNCILVAQFTPQTSPVAREVNKFIAQELNDILDAARTQNVGVKVIPPVADQKEAKRIARAENAILIVWGHVFESEGKTQVHFQLSDRLGISESADVRPFRVQPLLYGQLKESVECGECLEISGDIAQRANVIAYIATGLAHYAQGQPELARGSFLAALYCAGKLPNTEALVGWEVNCQADQESPEWNYGLLYYYTGKALLLQGDYSNAIDLLTKASADNPHDPAAWIGIGSAYQSWLLDPNAPLAQSAFITAEQKLATLPRLNMTPEDKIAAHFERGLIAELQGHLTDAIQSYEQTLKELGNIKGDPYVALVSLARAERIVGKTEVAETHLARAIDVDPNAPWAYLELARLQQSDREAALITLDKAEEAAPQEAYVNLTRSELCQSQLWRDDACAVANYTLALQKRRESGWLHSTVGDFYRPTKTGAAYQSWEKAIDHYQTAVDLRPCDPWIHARLAYVLAAGATKSYAEAIQHYQLAVLLAHPVAWSVQLNDVKTNLQILQEKSGMTTLSPAVPDSLCNQLLSN